MKKSGIIIFTMLISSHALASTSQWIPIAAIGGGITNTINLGKSDHFPIINPQEDEFYQYSPTHKMQTRGLAEAFLGIEHPFCGPWLLQAGVAYTQSGVFHPEGKLVQGADVQSEDQYHYHFSLTTRQVMLQTKWMYLMQDRFYPYLLLGLGAGINTASNYATTVPVSLAFTRLYVDKTSTNFAFRVGVGVDVDLGPHLRAGIAYRFADLGGSHLGSATIDQVGVSGTLSQSSIYANEVLAQFTWRF